MTTNMAECMNFVLMGAHSLPICALIKTTFKRTKWRFVERNLKEKSMLIVGHHLEDINALLRKKKSTIDHVSCASIWSRKIWIEVLEILTPHHQCQPMSYVRPEKIK